MGFLRILLIRIVVSFAQFDCRGTLCSTRFRSPEGRSVDVSYCISKHPEHSTTPVLECGCFVLHAPSLPPQRWLLEAGARLEFKIPFCLLVSWPRSRDLNAPRLLRLVVA